MAEILDTAGNAEEIKGKEGVEDENLSIEVTTRCNSSCGHCFARAGRSGVATLTPDTVKMIMDEGYRAGYRNLHLTGGEPLLWDGLFGILDRAKETGYGKIFLNTNGTMLTGEICGRLARYEGLTMSVSLQGPEALHDRFRGPGTYQNAALGIDRALDAGIETVIFTTVGKGLLPDLARFADETYRRFPGMRFLTLIQIIRVIGDALDLSEELLGPDDFIAMVKTAALLNLYGLKTDILENPLAGVAAKGMEMPWLPKAPLLHRPGRIIIMADRNITITHSSRESFGEYRPGMLAMVLASGEYQKAVADDVTVCPGCRFLDRCREQGMTRPSESNRDMKTGTPYCRRVLEMISP